MRYVVVLFVLVAGCATPEQQYAQQAADRAEYQRLLAQRCTSYGFTAGTLEFSNCVMQVDMSARNLLLQQSLQEESMRQERALPLCSSLGPGLRGYMKAQGRCR